MSELPIKRSDTIGALVAALAAAQSDFGPLVKTHENTYTGKKYADLADVIAATQPALAKNGLTVIQVPIRKDGVNEAGALSILAHSSGESISVELILPATMKAKDGALKFDQQSIGSAITYARRYTWQALVGVAAEEDDDGNAATDQSSSQSNVSTPKQPKTVKAPPVSQKVSSQGGERPQDSVRTVPGLPNIPLDTPTFTPAARQTNDPAPVESSVVPKAVIPADTTPVQLPLTPVESTSSQTEQSDKKADISGKPTKTQFDQYTARAILMKAPLEKAGLKPSKGAPTGTKLKNYLLAFIGVKELADLTIDQWEDFFTQHEQAIAAGQAELIVAKIEGGKS